MSLSADELIEKAKDQLKRKRPEEALVSALAATDAEPDNSDAWWVAALSRIALKDPRNAIIALVKTVEISPSADNAWSRLGTLRLNNGDQDEAKEAFIESLDWNSENIDALEGMAKIYVLEDDEDQDDEEASVLERIARLSYLDSGQLNRFGIIHYRAERHHEAIKYWRLHTAGDTDPSGRFNLGLAYNHQEVSQDADAIDMWRMVLRHWDDYERAKESITSLLPRMLELAKQVRSQGETLLPKEQWYEHYINPFELLNPSGELGRDDFDAKTIQKLKKTLLHEIALEDGAVHWLPGIKVDKSRAIGLCDELMNDSKRYFHWLVFSNKPLLNFLSKGSYEHFLVHESSSEIDTIEVIEDADSGFQEWLGDLFIPQFNRVLCKAIDVGNLVVLECLLDGRRWVPPSHADRCFQNARHAIDRRLQPLRDANKRADDEKPLLSQVKGLLNHGNLLGIMNLLPSYFEDFQNEAVNQLRGIAISSFNAHGDADQARQIVELAKQFSFRSADANRQIEEDAQQIEKLLQQERKHESKLTIGDKRCEVTKEGVRMGDLFIATTDVSTVRWGIMLSGERAAPSYDFSMVVMSDFRMRRHAAMLREHGPLTVHEPLADFDMDTARRNWIIRIGWHAVNDIKKQKDLFQGLVTATLNYILPSLIERVEKSLAAGHSIAIGPCTVSRHGLAFDTKGWIFTASHVVPWQRVRHSLNNGEITIHDIAVSKATVSFPFRDTDNAPLLQILINIKNGKDN